jgi:peroxiredoxin
MARAAALRRGDLIPGFALESVNRPGRIGPWDYKQRSNLVVLVLHGASCERCRRRLASTADLYGEIRAADAEVLAVVEDRHGAAAALDAPFPVLADGAGAVRSRYLEGGVGLFLVDRYNALFNSWLAPDADALPGAAELREWLTFLAVQCEECHPPEPWPSES